jgi:hypothetical protein
VFCVSAGPAARFEFTVVRRIVVVVVGAQLNSIERTTIRFEQLEYIHRARSHRSHNTTIRHATSSNPAELRTQQHNTQLLISLSIHPST